MIRTVTAAPFEPMVSGRTSTASDPRRESANVAGGELGAGSVEKEAPAAYVHGPERGFVRLDTDADITQLSGLCPIETDSSSLLAQASSCSAVVCSSVETRA